MPVKYYDFQVNEKSVFHSVK